MKHMFNSKGFTLVEMILYVSLCSILLLSLSTLFSFLLQSKIRSQVMAEVNQQGFQVMQLMSQTIRNGRSVETPTLGLASSTLSLTTANALLNPTLFKVATSTLYIQEGSGQLLPLINGRVTMSNLLFQNVSSASSTDRLIKISFTLSSTTTSPRSEYLYTKDFFGSATIRK